MACYSLATQQPSPQRLRDDWEVVVSMAVSGGSSWLLGALVPGVVGGVVAGLLSFGVLVSQTSAPSTNPAQQPILTYGTR